MPYSCQERRFKALQRKLETTRKHKQWLEGLLTDPDKWDIDPIKVKCFIQEDAKVILSLESFRCPKCGKCIFEREFKGQIVNIC